MTLPPDWDYWAYVKAVVDAAPPLSSEKRQLLAPLLRATTATTERPVTAKPAA